MYKLKVLKEEGTCFDFHTMLVPFSGDISTSHKNFHLARRNLINLETGVRALGAAQEISVNSKITFKNQEQSLKYILSGSLKENLVSCFSIEHEGVVNLLYAAKVLDPFRHAEKISNSVEVTMKATIMVTNPKEDIQQKINKNILVIGSAITSEADYIANEIDGNYVLEFPHSASKEIFKSISKFIRETFYVSARQSFKKETEVIVQYS